MRNLTIALVSVAAVALLAGSAQAGTIDVDDTLVPSDLGEGDTFRLAFTTSGTTDATSSDIPDYNTFVDNQAENTGSLVGGKGWDWKAIASTTDDDAIDNTGTNYTVAEPGYPIYRLDGNRVVDDYADLWDGKINTYGTQNTFDLDEQGADKNDTDNFWSGTDIDGTEYGSGGLGTANPWAGRFGWGHDPQWIRSATRAAATQLPMYALSEELTVIPEPASAVLLLLGLPLVIRRRRRRK